MSIEKDILLLLSRNETSYHEILSQLETKYKGDEIGISVTRLNNEMKIRMSNEAQFIYKITDLGKLELKNIVIRFYLIHWKLLLPIIVGSIVAIIVAVLNYIK